MSRPVATKKGLDNKSPVSCTGTRAKHLPFLGFCEKIEKGQFRCRCFDFDIRFGQPIVGGFVRSSRSWFLPHASSFVPLLRRPVECRGAVARPGRALS